MPRAYTVYRRKVIAKVTARLGGKLKRPLLRAAEPQIRICFERRHLIAAAADCVIEIARNEAVPRP